MLAQNNRTGNQKRTQAIREIEVTASCMNRVYTAKDGEDRVTLIQGTTGWIVVMEDALAGRQQPLLDQLEAVAGNVQDQVRAVVYTHFTFFWQEGIKKFLSEEQSELPVFVPGNGQWEQEADTVPGVAYWEIEKGGSVWIDGLEFQLIKGEQEEDGISISVPRYEFYLKANQKQEERNHTITVSKDPVESVVFQTRQVVEKLVERLDAWNGRKQDGICLLEVLDKGQFQHFAIKIDKKQVRFIEVEEELAEYFWDETFPIVQMEKSALRNLYRQNETTESIYRQLFQPGYHSAFHKSGVVGF